MNNQLGFALVILLIFINMLSVIIISMMNSTLFAAKTLENFSAYYRYIHLADIALQQAKQDILTENTKCFDGPCAMQGDFLTDHELLSYQISFLTTVPCFAIKNSAKSGADFFKILVKVGENQDRAINIQSTFVNVAHSAEHCYETVKTIKPGFLSWRLIG